MRSKVFIAAEMLILILTVSLMLATISSTTGLSKSFGDTTSNQMPDIYTIKSDDEGNIIDHIWSSDGTKIAYIKCPAGQFWGGELWVANKSPDSAQLMNHRLIFSGVECGKLEDWQGDWILFMIRYEEGTPTEYYGRNELWKIRYNGAELTQVTFTFTNGIKATQAYATYKNRGSVSWGRFIPGTDLIYFAAHDGNGWYQAYTCKDDGTDQWKLISVDSFSFTIAMSPTGNKLVWGHATYWDNPTTLMASNVDGSGTVTIKALSRRTQPLVLADGNTIIYSWRAGDIYAIDIDPPGSNERTVIDDEYFNDWANYDPVDGQGLIMVSDRADGNMHFFKIKTDGTGIVQLTDGPYNDNHFDPPFISPNGQFILYRRLPKDFPSPLTPPRHNPYELVVKRIAMECPMTVTDTVEVTTTITETVEVTTTITETQEAPVVPGLPDIYTIKSDNEEYITDYIWSSDGMKIAYIKCPAGQHWDSELWVADKSPDSAELTNHQLIYAGAEYNKLEDWQGDWILFMIRHEEVIPEYYGVRELWKIRADGTDLTQVTFTYTNGIRTEWWNTAYDNVGTVGYGRWISGTNLIYFSAHDGNGWYQAHTCKDDGTDGWKLISVGSFSFAYGNPSPTGNKLVWGHADYWNWPTTLMGSNVDGSDKITIKAFEKRTFPLILADGNTIIYSWRDGDIHAIDIDGSNDRMVIDDEFFNDWTNYDPVDGQALIMVSDRAADGNLHFFKIKIDGTGIVQLTDGPYNDEQWQPYISPNRQYILYSRLPADFDKGATKPPYPYELVVKRIADSQEAPGFAAIPTLLGLLIITFVFRRQRYRK